MWPNFDYTFRELRDLQLHGIPVWKKLGRKLVLNQSGSHEYCWEIFEQG